MHYKSILKGLITLTSLSVFSVSAQASSGFEVTLNAALGNGASVSCNACHLGSTSSATATLPMAVTWKNGGRTDTTLLATSDSDGDGYINQTEVSGSLVEFNDIATSPFTKATAANADANVIAHADNAAASATFTDSTATPLAATGQIILGDIKVTLNQTDTLYFKAGSVDSAATIYTVDAAGVGTDVTADCTISSVDGSLKVNTAPAGGFPADYVVVQGTASTTTFSADASVTGCVTSNTTLPLTLFLSMMMTGLVVRNKKK